MILLAPLHGYTDAEFRNAYAKYYSGIDEAITPFVSLVAGSKVKSSHLKDIQPERNVSWPIVPQVIGNNKDYFVVMANDIEKLGYNELNWNLGCPIPQIARKKRGAGLLPYPYEIKNILENVFSQTTISVSLKIRLGYNNEDECLKLAPILNNFPIKRIVVHPRIGTQMYEGELLLETFEKFLHKNKHPIVFSGDIVDLSSYYKIKNKFPQINDFMIGRGVFTNLLLPYQIKTGDIEVPENYLETFLCFQETIIQNYNNRGMKDRNLLNKLKEFWLSFKVYTQREDLYEKLKLVKTIDEFRMITERLV